MLAVIEPGGGGCGGRTFNLQHHGGAAPYSGRDPFKHQASRAPASFYLNLSLYLSVLIHTYTITHLSFVFCVSLRALSPFVSSHPRAYAKTLHYNTTHPFFFFFDFSSINIQKRVFTSAIRTNTRLYERNSANTRLYERNPFKTRLYERSKPRFFNFSRPRPGGALRKFFPQSTIHCM